MPDLTVRISAPIPIGAKVRVMGADWRGHEPFFVIGAVLRHQNGGVNMSPDGGVTSRKASWEFTLATAGDMVDGHGATDGFVADELEEVI